jgi:hypothetical protein
MKKYEGNPFSKCRLLHPWEYFNLQTCVFMYPEKKLND